MGEGGTLVLITRRGRGDRAGDRVYL